MFDAYLWCNRCQMEKMQIMKHSTRGYITLDIFMEKNCYYCGSDDSLLIKIEESKPDESIIDAKSS